MSGVGIFLLGFSYLFFYHSSVSKNALEPWGSHLGREYNHTKLTRSLSGDQQSIWMECTPAWFQQSVWQSQGPGRKRQTTHKHNGMSHKLLVTPTPQHLRTTNGLPWWLHIMPPPRFWKTTESWTVGRREGQMDKGVGATVCTPRCAAWSVMLFVP